MCEIFVPWFAYNSGVFPTLSVTSSIPSSILSSLHEGAVDHSDFIPSNARISVIEFPQGGHLQIIFFQSFNNYALKINFKRALANDIFHNSKANNFLINTAKIWSSCLFKLIRKTQNKEYHYLFHISWKNSQLMTTTVCGIAQLYVLIWFAKDIKCNFR